MFNKAKKTTRGISTFDFFCIGFGSIVGVGWAVSLNRWMAACGGPLPASLGYILALIMMIPIALCYCELAPMMPVAGGGMAYAYKAFNQHVGFLSGWAAFGAFVTIIPWEAIYVVDILGILAPFLKGPELYVLAGVGIHLGHIIIGTIFSIMLFFINYKGASGSAFFQRVMMLLLLSVGLIAIIAAVIKFDAANFQPIYENVGQGAHTGFFMGSLAILASAPFFLAGFETIPQGVEDASGDIKAVGKTVVIVVALACAFYSVLLFALGAAMPWQEFYDLPTPAASQLFKIVYDGSLGLVLYYAVLIGALMGLFTTWNGFMMASPRLLMSMARGYMIPKFLAKQHPKYGTPTNALIACFILSLMGPFLGMGLINPLTSFSAAGFVFSWMITAFCVVKLRKTHPDIPRPYKIPGGTATALFAGIIMVIVFILLFIPGNPAFMGGMSVKLFIGWMALGLIFYGKSSKKRNMLTLEEREIAVFQKSISNI